MKIIVEIFTRSGCHLCQKVEELIRSVQESIPFNLRVTMIDGNPDLEKRYGEEVPVTFINGQQHDYFQVNEERFRKALILASSNEIVDR